MSTVNVASASQFRTILGSSNLVITDFYADWCGPCKQVSPVFESLSKKHSKPNVVTFTKVNVDSQREIASQYGVSAMPTFIIFKNGSVAQTIKGADPRALTTAIENAVRGAGPAKPTYSSVGRTLGGTPARGQSLQRPPFDTQKLVRAIVTFFGLYIVSLLSFDAYGSAEKSIFNIHAVPQQRTSKPDNKKAGAGPQVGGKKLGTIADFAS